VREVLGVFLWTRAAIWVVAAFAFLAIDASPDPDAWPADDPALPRDLGFLTEIWARFDSVPLLHIARGGYDSDPGGPAFYPLYPALVAGLGRILAGHYILAGILVSLAAFLGALALLLRVAEPRIGEAGARRAVLYISIFPMAFLFQAVYSESLFLLLSLAAFLLAERGRFAEAGLVAGLAWLTRPFGIAVLPALALIAWRAPPRARALAGLCLAPLVFLAYPLVLRVQTGDAWAFLHIEDQWFRERSPVGPLGGIWNGLRAAWASVLQLTVGSETHWYWTPVNPDRAAVFNLASFGFLCLFLALTVVVWRRLGSAYGLYAAVSLAIPLSLPSAAQPLPSLTRYGLVVFPFFLALALLGARPRVHDAIVVLSALLLAVAVVQWATLQSGIW
jgi:hypothetical protein